MQTKKQKEGGREERSKNVKIKTMLILIFLDRCQVSCFCD